MKIKTVEVNGVEYAVLDKGQPVYIHDDGKEIPFDAKTTVGTISRLNGEAKSHRERAEAAEAKLKGFDGITDVTAALAALETVGKLSDKKLIEAGEVDRVRAEAKKAFDDKLRGIEEGYAPVIKERDSLKAALVAEKVGGSFSRSKYIADKLAIPADIVQAMFGDRFKLDGDQVVGYDSNGEKIFSRAKPGTVATFDEAVESLVEGYSRKDSILKSSGANGGGAGAGGAGNGASGKKSLTREIFDSLDPAQKTAHFKSGGTVVNA